eukprot:m.1280707 g.1280707  ORF g.1280707 m.1280707 type:complete len:310 (+) comp24769_c0_seq20:706-1635(+)
MILFAAALSRSWTLQPRSGLSLWSIVDHVVCLPIWIYIRRLNHRFIAIFSGGGADVPREYALESFPAKSAAQLVRVHRSEEIRHARLWSWDALQRMLAEERDDHAVGALHFPPKPRVCHVTQTLQVRLSPREGLLEMFHLWFTESSSHPGIWERICQQKGLLAGFERSSHPIAPRICAVEPRFEAFQSVVPWKFCQNFHCSHNSHTSDARCVVASQQVCKSYELLPIKAQASLQLRGAVLLRALVLGTHTTVHIAPAEQEDVAVVRDGPFGQAVQLHRSALCFGLHWCHYVWQPEHAQHCLCLGNHGRG